MATITSTTNSSTQLRVATNTSQAPAKTGATQSLDSSAVKVQISDKARQAMASPMEKAVKAASNLEKQATKLAERAASKDISDSERQKLSAAMQSINGAIKGLGGKQVSMDTYRKQETGTTGPKDSTAVGSTNQKTQQSTPGTATAASGNNATPAKTQSPSRSAALAAAAENTTRKNEAARAALTNLAKVYGGGTETASGRLNLVA